MSRATGEDQKIGDPKEIQRLLKVFLAISVRNQGTSRIIVWNTKRCWRGKVARILLVLVNRSSSTTIDFQIPEEIWRGEYVNSSTLWIFGCLAYSFAVSKKKINWSSSSRSVSSSGSSKESRVHILGSWDKEDLYQQRCDLWLRINIVRKVREGR